MSLSFLSDSLENPLYFLIRHNYLIVICSRIMYISGNDWMFCQIRLLSVHKFTFDGSVSDYKLDIVTVLINEC